MFRIDYKITVEDDDLIVGRYGLIEMEVNGKILNGVLISESNPNWDEVILYFWFFSWLECAILLYSNKYVAFTEFEASKFWLEVNRYSESVSLSLVKSDQLGPTMLITKLGCVEILEESPTVWVREVISFNEFIDEINRVSSAYIEELQLLNKKNNKMLTKLKNIYHKFHELYF